MLAVTHAVIGIIIRAVTVGAANRGTMIRPAQIITELDGAIAVLGRPDVIAGAVT